MQFYIFRIMAILLFVALAACSRQPNERRAADGSLQTTQPSPTAQAIPYVAVRRITISELRAALRDGSAIVVDVRNPEEYKARAIKGAIYIDELSNNARLNELARKKLVVTYCS